MTASQDKAVALSDKDAIERLNKLAYQMACVIVPKLVSDEKVRTRIDLGSLNHVTEELNSIRAALEAREAQEQGAMKRLRVKVEAKIAENKRAVEVILGTSHRGSVLIASMLTARIEPYKWMLAEIDGDSNSSTGETK